MRSERSTHHDFWRISFDGRASVLRSFREDNFERVPRGLDSSQKWFDPWLQTRDVTELVRHARAHAEEFEEVTDICFLLEWKGLGSRVVATVSDRHYSDSYTSHNNWRKIYLRVPYAEVIGNMSEVAARLIGPVSRMFSPLPEIDATYIKRQLPYFRGR
jgi:hypothetical protein